MRLNTPGKAQFSEELHDLREQRNGNMIIKLSTGTDDKPAKMKIKFVAADLSESDSMSDSPDL